MHPGWDVEKVSETLDAPKPLASGATVTERVSQIVYTAKNRWPTACATRCSCRCCCPSPPARPSAFPVLQTCEKGETNWAEIPAEGQDPHDLKSPAPSFVIGEASTDSHGGHDGGASSDGAQAADASGTEASDTGASDTGAAGVAGWAGLGAGLLGLAAGVTALARTRKKG